MYFWDVVRVIEYCIGIKVFVKLVRAYMYELCASGAANTQGFVWRFI